ncbi:hypothetical protein ACVBEH_32065, partial [Roseateles sp. GG27B]
FEAGKFELRGLWPDSIPLSRSTDLSNQAFNSLRRPAMPTHHTVFQAAALNCHARFASQRPKKSPT